MQNELNELFGIITDEEKAAASAHIRGRIEAIQNQNDGPIRARLFAAATLVSGAELFARLDSLQPAAEMQHLPLQGNNDETQH